MSEILKQQIALLISNTIRIALFVMLAIAFEKWWIALFSVLFLTSTKENKND